MAFQPKVIVYVNGVNATQIAEYLNTSKIFTAYVGGSPSVVKDFNAIFVNTTSHRIYYSQLTENYMPVLNAYLSSYDFPKDYGGVMETTRNTPIAYEISGVIGVIALSNGVFGVTGVGSGYYRDKLVERLASSPIKDYEWVLALMIYEVVITLISSITVLIIGVIMGFIPDFGLPFLGIYILSTLMFSGLGAIILGLTPKEKIILANIVSNFIVFPLMFFSNAFYSASIFPSVLKIIAEYQPVSIINDLVRETLVLQQLPNPIYLGEVILLTLVFLAVGSRLLRLREV
ncbi:MAG: ABC transporter permease [Sulfolobus sp.]